MIISPFRTILEFVYRVRSKIGLIYAAFFVAFNLLWAMIFDYYVPNLRDKVVIGMITVTLLVGIFWSQPN